MPGIFSGNGSVAWTVDGANVREADMKLSPAEKGAPRRVRQSGTDETDPGERFTISIKVPQNERDADAFIEELRKRAQALKRGQTLRLSFPIEDRRYNSSGKPTKEQIVIGWPSSTRTGGAKAT
jgi:hypothetical protein